MENSSRDGNIRPLYLPPERYVRQVKKQVRTGHRITNVSKVKEYVKAVYCHLAYLTYTQSISCKVLGWMKHKPESRLLGEISITSDMQMTPPLRQKVERN